MAEIENIPAAVQDYWNSHPNTIWLYDANFPLAIVAAVLYAIPMVYIFYQTCFKYKSYYFIVVFFGALLEFAGYVIRAISIKNYTSIVSPSFFFPSFLTSLRSQNERRKIWCKRKDRSTIY